MDDCRRSSTLELIGGVNTLEKKTRSEAYYLDDDHNIVDPDKATKVVINEYDENGVMIREIWGYTDRMLHQQKRKQRWLKKIIDRIRKKGQSRK